MAPHSNFPALPLLVDDETLYSWCATVHAVDTGLSAAQTGVQLLGSPHAARQHDLPASLTRLPLLGGRSPTEGIDLLRRHTIANFYWPFTSVVARQSVVGALRGGATNHWRRTLCSSSRTQPIEHPLKWCPACVVADQDRIGRPYWHVQHQFPTTTVCPLHHSALHQTPGHQKVWLLPSKAVLQFAKTDSLPSRSARVLERVGGALTRIDAIDIAFLRKSALRRLREAGVIFSSNGVSHERIERWFSQTPTAAWCEATGNGLENFRDGKWISSMLWRRHLGNAVRWVVLWSALNWESPEVAVASFTDACRGHGHDFGGQLTLFGMDAEMPTRAPEHVWEAFSECSSYADAMLKLQCRRSDVVRWLELDPELRFHWRRRLRSEKQAQCLTTIRTALTANPNLTRRTLEEQFSADVRWLRQYAFRELDELLRAIPARDGKQSELLHRNPPPDCDDAHATTE